MDQERVVLVTGVSSGIGKETAALLLKQQFRTFGTVRDTGHIADAPKGLELVRLDVRDDVSVKSGVQTLLDRAGRIDSLVNNAGYSIAGSVEETSIEEARRLFETNFFGVIRMSQAVLPIMRNQQSGRIVNISSILGFLPGPYLSLYTASKHALEGLSESFDHEVRQFGIRVSVVEPGFTSTSLGVNNELAARPVTAYSNERDRAVQAITHNIANGVDPFVVASAVLNALTSPSPRLRYTAGREARVLALLRKYAPSSLLDKGVRKQFGL